VSDCGPSLKTAGVSLPVQSRRRADLDAAELLAEAERRLAEALDALFGPGAGGVIQPPATTQPPVTQPPDGGEPPPVGEPLPGDVASLIAEAQQAFADADQALRDGNLSLYAAKIAEAEARIARAAELLTQAVGAVPG